MKKITVQTGFGYFKDKQGRIISKAELIPGKHPIKDGYSYVELNSQQEMDSIEIYAPPESLEIARERKIQSEMRLMAEERLNAKGEI